MRRALLISTLSLCSIFLILLLAEAAHSTNSQSWLQNHKNLIDKSYINQSTQSAIAQPIETLYLETRLNGRNNPVIGTQSLEIDKLYVIQVAGTWSPWYASRWSSYCGPAEDSPTIPSPGVQNGKVGVDAAYTFAAPSNSGWCPLPEPKRWRDFEISLDGGASWLKIDPIGNAYREDHVYDYAVIGQGLAPRFRILDDYYVTDNYGILEISINPGCEIPFFWQEDPRWANYSLGTDGRCSPNCSTIGACGCTLTSAAMLFSFYDNYIEPNTLSQCMGNSACPFNWQTECAGSTTTWDPSVWSFSYDALNEQLNVRKRPVLVGMRKGHDTHWVLVTSGQGDTALNYKMNDPAIEKGENLPLDLRLQWGWEFVSMRAYNSQPSCVPVVIPSNINPTNIAPVQQSQESEISISTVNQTTISSGSTITGAVWLYHATPLTMTVHITATSMIGAVTEVQVWNQDNPTPEWQPFTPYIWLTWSPGGEVIFVRFQDEMGNISETYSASPNPLYSPPPDPWRNNWIPIVMKSP